MTYLFVHGWGYHPGVWKDIAAKLVPDDVAYVDFGYFGEKSLPSFAALRKPVIAIGHSFGVLWLLTQTDLRFHALVSLAGFDCFFAHVKPAELKAMQLGVKRNPARLLRDFWARCGAEPLDGTHNLNAKMLGDGLAALAAWDGRNALRSFDGPILALASRDDKIVPPTMIETIWAKETVRWVDSGNHALPITQPNWCAKEIQNFARQLTT